MSYARCDASSLSYTEVDKYRFLLVSRHLARILDCVTIGEIYHCLDTLPETLSEDYDQAWKRATSQRHRYQQDQARIALTWILLTKQPLSVLALNEAVAVCMGIIGGSDFLPDLERLCAGLVKTVRHACPHLGISDLCSEAQAHTRVLVAHSSISEYFENRRHIYFPSGEQLIIKACLWAMRDSVTMARTMNPFTPAVARINERFDRFLEPHETRVCHSRSSLPAAETLMQYSTVWSATHITLATKKNQLKAWITVGLSILLSIRMIHETAMLFTRVVLKLNGIIDIEDNHTFILFILHYVSCTRVAIQLMQVSKQPLATLVKVEYHTLVRRLRCHHPGHQKHFAQSVHAYITFSYFRGKLVWLQWTSWCLVFDVVTQAWTASKLCLDALSGRLGCKCVKCTLLGTSQDAVVVIVGIIGCSAMIELLSPNKGSFSLDPSFGLAPRLLCDSCLQIVSDCLMNEHWL